MLQWNCLLLAELVEWCNKLRLWSTGIQITQNLMTALRWKVIYLLGTIVPQLHPLNNLRAVVGLEAYFYVLDSFFSWNVGPAHIIGISTEVYYFYNYGIEQIVQQYEWLEKDLQVRGAKQVLKFCLYFSLWLLYVLKTVICNQTVFVRDWTVILDISSLLINFIKRELALNWWKSCSKNRPVKLCFSKGTFSLYPDPTGWETMVVLETRMGFQ